MHFGTNIELVRMTDDLERSGLAGPYKEATFLISSDGVRPFEVRIPLHPAWPEKELEKVALSFLSARLAEAAKTPDVYTPAQLDALWSTVKPADAAIAG